jgi:hypothetical protein
MKYTLGAFALVVGAVGAAFLLPDFIRYMKIRSM